MEIQISEPSAKDYDDEDLVNGSLREMDQEHLAVLSSTNAYQTLQDITASEMRSQLSQHQTPQLATTQHMVEVRVEDCYSDTEGDDDVDDDESGDGFEDEDEGSFLQDYDQLLTNERKVETQITPSNTKQQQPNYFNNQNPSFDQSAQPSQLQAAASHFQILDQEVSHQVVSHPLTSVKKRRSVSGSNDQRPPTAQMRQNHQMHHYQVYGQGSSFGAGGGKNTTMETNEEDDDGVGDNLNRAEDDGQCCEALELGSDEGSNENEVEDMTTTPVINMDYRHRGSSAHKVSTQMPSLMPSPPQPHIIDQQFIIHSNEQMSNNQLNHPHHHHHINHPSNYTGFRLSQVVSSSGTLDNEIRNMTYTHTIQGQQSEAVLLTDMSPFGATTTHGRESIDRVTNTQVDRQQSQNNLLNSDMIRLQSSLDTETLQVMFADSMTTAHVKEAILQHQESEEGTQPRNSQVSSHAIQLVKRNMARQMRASRGGTSSNGTAGGKFASGLAQSDDLKSIVMPFTRQQPQPQLMAPNDNSSPNSQMIAEGKDEVLQGSQQKQQDNMIANLPNANYNANNTIDSLNHNTTNVLIPIYSSGTTSNGGEVQHSPSTGAAAVDFPHYQIQRISANGGTSSQQGEEPLSILQQMPSDAFCATETTEDQRLNQLMNNGDIGEQSAESGEDAGNVGGESSEDGDSSSLNNEVGVEVREANFGSSGAVDLDHYCGTLIEMIAQQVPEVQSYLQNLRLQQQVTRGGENGCEIPASENLLGVISLLISILPSQNRTLQIVKNLQQQVLQSKRDLRLINNSYVNLQAENTLMRTQLKTASCSARLKQAQADLKQAQGQISSLKRQLRRSQKEVDQLKHGSTNYYQKDLSNSAYSLPVTECRRILQSVSNIVYSETDSPPDLKRLPQLVAALRDSHSSKHQSQVPQQQTTLSMVDNSHYTTKTISEVDNMFTGRKQLKLRSAATTGPFILSRSPNNRSVYNQLPMMQMGSQSTPWSAKGNQHIDLNLINSKMKEQAVVSERPLQVRQRSNSKLEPNTTGRTASRKVHQVQTFDKSSSITAVDLRIPSTSKSINNRGGRLMTENSQVSADLDMQKQIIKALDLDSDQVSHQDIIEQIKKNKILAEEATKSREIVEGLKSTMRQLQGKVNSRSTENYKPFLGLKENTGAGCPANQSIHSDQQPEYQTGKFFNEDRTSSNVVVSDQTYVTQHQSRSEFGTINSQRRRKQLFNNFVDSNTNQNNVRLGQQFIEPPAEVGDSPKNIKSQVAVNQTLNESVNRRELSIDKIPDSQMNIEIKPYSAQRPKKSKQPSQSMAAQSTQLQSSSSQKLRTIGQQLQNNHQIQLTQQQMPMSSCSHGFTVEDSHVMSRLTQLKNKQARLSQMLLNTPTASANNTNSGTGIVISNQGSSSSHQHPIRQWREALQPMMKSNLSNSSKERVSAPENTANSTYKAYTPGANLHQVNVPNNLSVETNRHVNNLRLSGQFTSSMAANNDQSQLSKSSPVAGAQSHKQRAAPYSGSVSQNSRYGYSGTRRGGRSQNNHIPNQQQSTFASAATGATSLKTGANRVNPIGCSSSLTSSALNSYSAVKQQQQQNQGGQIRALSSAGLRHGGQSSTTNNHQQSAGGNHDLTLLTNPSATLMKSFQYN